MVYAQIAMAAGGAISSYLAAGKAEKAARARFEAEQKRLEAELEQSKDRTSRQLGKLERFTENLQREGSHRDTFMEQAVMAGTRRSTAAETERQQGAAGMTGAGRIRSAQMVAGAQAQGLLAVESTRQQRERELNQLVSQNMAQAAQISQAGYAVEQQTRSQITAARTNLMMAQEQASARKTGALISGFAGMAAAGIEAYGGDTTKVTDEATKRAEELSAVDKKVRGMASDMGGFYQQPTWYNPWSWDSQRD
jgi:hypothetical protein